ncbi:hypothetical protein O181_109149 [Austropuccinia psidii MF-1]|uniref:CCHC-type domain-containing protein n=1 Tax=Austropuccinia psidii MF-1 TaxID=1389203 RepID=A0A9Q3PPL9_9BASI|nr:hypothetical protein [Austropuccinia psidii MF-1]
MRNHTLLRQLPGELEHEVKCRCDKDCNIDDIANTLQEVRKKKNKGKYSPYKGNSSREKQLFRVFNKDTLREIVSEVLKKRNSCHNCGSKYHYANNCPKAKRKIYAIENVPEEEVKEEDSESDSMSDVIRKNTDYDK